jgi:ADP-heptose:LPS heptosyltransferase
MRVRLDIARHELPSVKILWHVPSEATTISKLLEQVHDVIPLESDGWGIEDYAVEVNGYEALHFLHPATILQENDEVRYAIVQLPPAHRLLTSIEFELYKPPTSRQEQWLVAIRCLRKVHI